jgi:hypothetical protein
VTAKDLTNEDRLRLNGYVTSILDKNAAHIEDLMQDISHLIDKRITRRITP